MRTFLALCLLMLCFVNGLIAQDTKQKQKKTTSGKHNQFEIGLIGGVMTYTGDVHSTDIFLKQSKPAAGAYFRYHLNDHLSTRFNVIRGRIAGSDSLFLDEWRWKRNFNFTSNVWDVNAAIEWEPLGHKRYGKANSFQKLLTPYFSLGLGVLHGKPKVNFYESINPAYATQIALDKKISKNTFFSIPFGTGLRMDLTRNLTVSGEVLFRTPFSDYLDGISEAGNPKNKDWYYTAFVTLGYRLNYIQDKDKDGIPDAEDTCPDMAGKKETKGCPDGDGDGVPDASDDCPTQVGTLNGCLDSDKDGISDKNDACPNQAGTAATKGCPDRDGDGIIDAKDACPDNKGTASFNGCPDTDGDGVIDKEDDCPQIAGLKTEKGCPLKDLDQDNVPDKDDLCPDKAGTIANNGCPDLPKPEPVKVVEETPKVISVVEAAVFDEALYGVEFESGSAIIRKKSYPILDKIFDIMQQRNNLFFEIEGHTDNSGNAKDNMKLSQERSKAVYNYLVKKGVANNRLLPKGYGESQPLVTNNSTENRAKNRRVQFKIK